jgi:hypothetical protein
MEKPTLTARQHLDAWTARMSQKCSCGGKKPQGQPFCQDCWQVLPAAMRAALLEHMEHYLDERCLEAEAFLAKRRKAHPTVVETPAWLMEKRATPQDLEHLRTCTDHGCTTCIEIRERKDIA